jgi:hypothetical protein
MGLRRDLKLYLPATGWLTTWSKHVCLALALLTAYQPLAPAVHFASTSLVPEELEVVDTGKQSLAASHCRVARPKRLQVAIPCPLTRQPEADPRSSLPSAASAASAFLSIVNLPLHC